MTLPVLDYGAYREFVKDGDIILFKGERLMSKLIRRLTNSLYSHVGIAAWWGERLMVLAAESHGVTSVPLSSCVAKYRGEVELYTTDAVLNRDKVVSAAKEELGKRYAVWGLVRGLRRVLLKFTGTPDPVKPPEKFFCSQYLAYCWRAGGIDVAEGISDDFTQPQDIIVSKHVNVVGTLKR